MSQRIVLELLYQILLPKRSRTKSVVLARFFVAVFNTINPVELVHILHKVDTVITNSNNNVAIPCIL
jgi:hypothetical protein